MLTKVKALLAGLLAAVAAFAKKNPAVVSYVLSIGVALAAKYGLNVTPAELSALLLVLLTAAHGWLHVATRKKS